MLTRRRAPGPSIGPVPLDTDALTRHLLFTGGTGSGKSHTMYRIIEALIRLGCCIIVACAKFTEAAQIRRICERAGALDRYHPITPDGPLRVNLADYLMTMPGGSTAQATRFLMRLNEISVRQDGSRGDEAYWANLFEQGTNCSLDLPRLAYGTGTLKDAYDALATSPASREEINSDAYKASKCGQMLEAASRLRKREFDAGTRDPRTERRYERVVDFFLRELATVGSKGRGAVLSMNSGLTGRLLVDFHDLFCTETTLDFARAEREGWVMPIDAPVLTHDVAGKVVNAAFIMLFQMYALRRDASTVSRPLIICRDEAAQFLIPDWDWNVATVARSHMLSHIDAVQGLEVLESALGGDMKAEREAQAFASQHRTLIAFGNNEPKTNEYVSKLIGMERDFMMSAQPRPEQPKEISSLDDVLGCAQGYGYSEQYQPIIRPEEFARFDVGQCVLMSGGRYRFLDLKEKR